MNEIREIKNSGGVPVDTSTIPGWGTDIDPANNPTYPYRLREGDDHSGQWQRPTVQDAQVEILRRSSTSGARPQWARQPRRGC
jgi:hypothetical protein